MTSATATYVTYYYPGTFFSEESGQQVEHRDPRQAAIDAPPGAFAFTFHDQVTATVAVDGQEVTLSSRSLKKTGRYYIDAEKLTEADVEAMGGEFRTLLDNMRGNRWPAVVRCRHGNFQPLHDGDQIVKAA